jgi:hypothetical protein
MIDWAYVLTPLLVLPLILLFRFVGCALIAGIGEASSDDPPPAQNPPPNVPANPPPSTPPLTPAPPPATPPNYRGYIMGDPINPGTVKNPGVVPSKANVVAYWRLVDAPAATLAKDENNFQAGEYRSGQALDFEAPDPGLAGSEAATGNFVTGQNGLIVSDPTSLSRFFNGGYVFVPFKNGLFTDAFTIEAWIFPGMFKSDFEYTLFDAGGTYGAPETDRGFRLFVDRTGRWQAAFSPDTPLFQPGPLVPLGAASHIAMTLQDEAGGTGKKTVTLYVNGKVAGLGTLDTYARPDGAPLFIGVENTLADPTDTPLALRTPALMRIQEAVIHRKALSLEEIQNHVDINRH